jgi:DNA-binding transcriptional LysR family regulator
MNMHESDISRADLNLLVVFEVLMAERHVGRAAKRLSLSQSATSHALGRLRLLLRDQLFIRTSRGIEPTARAKEISKPIAETLTQIRTILYPVERFDAAKLTRIFRVAAHDYAMVALMPPLLEQLRVHAPGIDLRLLMVQPEKIPEQLERGDLDFALGGFLGVKVRNVSRIELLSDRFVGVARRDHPQVRGERITLRNFNNAPHVIVAAGGETRGGIDGALRHAGATRRVVVTTPNFLALPFLVENSDLIGVLPERLALRMMATTPLTIFNLPVRVEPMSCSVLVLKANLEQPEIRWFLQLLQQAAA